MRKMHECDGRGHLTSQMFMLVLVFVLVFVIVPILARAAPNSTAGCLSRRETLYDADLSAAGRWKNQSKMLVHETKSLALVFSNSRFPRRSHQNLAATLTVTGGRVRVRVFAPGRNSSCSILHTGALCQAPYLVDRTEYSVMLCRENLRDVNL